MWVGGTDGEVGKAVAGCWVKASSHLARGPSRLLHVKAWGATLRIHVCMPVTPSQHNCPATLHTGILPPQAQYEVYFVLLYSRYESRGWPVPYASMQNAEVRVGDAAVRQCDAHSRGDLTANALCWKQPAGAVNQYPGQVGGQGAGGRWWLEIWSVRQECSSTFTGRYPGKVGMTAGGLNHSMKGLNTTCGCAPARTPNDFCICHGQLCGHEYYVYVWVSDSTPQHCLLPALSTTCMDSAVCWPGPAALYKAPYMQKQNDTPRRLAVRSPSWQYQLF